MSKKRQILIVTPGLQRGRGADVVGKGLFQGFLEWGALEASLYDWGLYYQTFATLLKPADETPLDDMVAEHLVVHCVERTPDIVVIVTLTPITAYYVLLLRKLGIQVVHWLVEDYRLIPDWPALLTPYDHVWCCQRDFLSQNWAAQGVQACSFLPLGCQKPEPPGTTPIHDLVFMGFPYPKRQHLLAHLLQHKISVKIWGHGWCAHLSNPLFAPTIQASGHWFTPTDIQALYAQAKIGLNIHSSAANPDPNDYSESLIANTYLFEICASGTFQLVDRRPSTLEHYEEEREIVCYGFKEELLDKIAYYLPRPELRHRIAQAGCERTRQSHTYLHRAQRAIQALDGRSIRS